MYIKDIAESGIEKKAVFSWMYFHPVHKKTPILQRFKLMNFMKEWVF
jgi:hypothetical protein